MKVEQICEIHKFLVGFFNDSDDPISPPGIKDKGLLESACARPYATAGGREVHESEFQKAAALFHGIISNHCFYNGNKRTALLSTLYFLGEHNYWLEKCDDDTMFDFTRQVAAHEICSRREDELSVIVDWLGKNSRRVMKGDKPLSYLELREVLRRFDFEIEEDGVRFVILKDGEVVEKILKKGTQGVEDYDPGYIARMRKNLGLTIEYGIDSARFYGQKGISEELNEFMILRGEVFKRLARI